MKRTFPMTIFFALLASLIAACATGDRGHRVEGITSNFEQVDNDLRAALAHVDAVEASLDGLVRSDNEDLVASFQEYSGQVAEMERIGEQLEEHADAMRSQGLEYFDEWRASEETVSNPEVREISEQRLEETRDSFTQVSRSSTDVKRALQTYISDLRDIETFLSHDLTPAGIEAITPVAEQAKEDGSTLQQAISPMMSALDQARTRMQQGSPDAN